MKRNIKKPRVIFGLFLMFGGWFFLPFVIVFLAESIGIYLSKDIKAIVGIIALIGLTFGMIIGIIILNRVSREERLNWQKETREKVNEWKDKGYNVDEVDELLQEIE